MRAISRKEKRRGRTISDFEVEKVLFPFAKEKKFYS